ncbi:hypothetical protein N7471_008516 [Penicillium samsonianum]|uniref:uncharacterized protein n=1 Tax=Penicillium samsonianum TaxID=1882272 RepID=UPI0025482FCE|nr:uncharacterized protein N7471_008516 [Penicillium samsonianum]KAJ6133301.1 hypothetical protein N7471_008516 [Penicillium samsonianum]
MQPPASEVGQPPLPSADWSPYDPSMNHASASLESNWTMQTQPPASAVGQRPVHSAGLSPYDPSMSHAFASLDPNWTTHTTMVHSPVDNQGNMQSSSTGQYRATEVGTEDHLDPGQTTIRIQSSTPSPSTQETSPPNQHDIEVAGVEATSVHHEPQERE